MSDRKILVVNDDGIDSEGIVKLAELAGHFGEVWVVAPASQCSAMSHRLTVKPTLTFREVPDFPLPDVHAYSLTGTPADCVKVAIQVIMDEKPDLVFSGINEGFNVGRDICYSGTVGAAIDGRMYGIPSIAYSLEKDGEFDVIETYFDEITEMLLKKVLGQDEIWNVNFPKRDPDQVKGILFERIPDGQEYYFDHYEVLGEDEEGTSLEPVFVFPKKGGKGTDVEAVIKGFISIGKVKNLTP